MLLEYSLEDAVARLGVCMLNEEGVCNAVDAPGNVTGRVGCTGGGQYEASRRASEKNGLCIYVDRKKSAGIAKRQSVTT